MADERVILLQHHHIMVPDVLSDSRDDRVIPYIDECRKILHTEIKMFSLRRRIDRLLARCLCSGSDDRDAVPEISKTLRESVFISTHIRCEIWHDDSDVHPFVRYL